jgi:hypothetical protein
MTDGATTRSGLDEYAQAEEEAHRYLDLATQEASRVFIASVRSCDPSAQRIRWRKDNWKGVAPAAVLDRLPTDGVSRADVLAVAREVVDGGSPATDLLVASFIWGQGSNGYGPHRLEEILLNNSSRTMPALDEALRRLRQCDPGGAYAWLHGEAPARASSFQAPGTGRLKHWGPAFFTKFLFFAGGATPLPLRPLVLDARVAAGLHAVTGMPRLVRSGRACSWSHFRYEVYLHWARSQATLHRVSPDNVEYALFEVGSRR